MAFKPRIIFALALNDAGPIPSRDLSPEIGQMRIHPSPIFLAALLISTGLAAGETRTFKEHNFSIDLPDGWSETSAPSPAVFAAKNSSGEKIFIAIATKMPEAERSSAIRNMAGGAKDATKKKGWKIVSEGQITRAGLTFLTFKSETPEGATIINWITSAGSEAYALQGIYKGGDASSDQELQSLLGSFHLLSAAPANSLGLDRDSAAYKAGRTFGCCLTVGIPIAIVIGLIVWLRRRNKPKPPPLP